MKTLRCFTCKGDGWVAANKRRLTWSFVKVAMPVPPWANERKVKSARGLWNTARTASDRKRPFVEVETDALLWELIRRWKLSKMYHDPRFARKYGPTSAITVFNERAIVDIYRVLEARDGLDLDTVRERCIDLTLTEERDDADSETSFPDGPALHVHGAPRGAEP